MVSRVTWATSVPILVILGLFVPELGPMYATDIRQKHHLMPLPIRGGGIITRELITALLACGYIGRLYGAC